MARVLTTFITPSNAVVDSPFRSVTPKRAILKRHINDTSDLSGYESTIADFIEFPFGPKDLKYDGMSANMVEIGRPGKKPLLEKENEKLRGVTFNAVIAEKSTGGKLSVIPMLQTLEMLAGSGAVCSFTYGTTKLGFNVCLTNFSYTVKYRNAEGEPVRVDAGITLKEKPVFTQELVQLDVIPFTPPLAKPGAPAEDSGPDLPPWLTVSTNLTSALTDEQMDRLKILYQKSLEDPQTYGQEYEDTLKRLIAYIPVSFGS
jgi:hypothetical protein